MFGLEGSAITRASDLHWLLGPILFVAYALLSSTLLITTTVGLLTSCADPTLAELSNADEHLDSHLLSYCRRLGRCEWLDKRSLRN